MLQVQKKLDYEIKLLEDNKIEEAAYIIGLAFQDEVISSTLAISPEEYTKFLKPRLKDSVEKELSLALYEGEKMVAVVFSDDFTEHDFDYEDKKTLDAKFSPIFTYLDKLHENPKEQELIKSGKKFYHLFFAASLREARGKGYMRKLFTEAHTLASKKGFDYVILEASSDAIRHISNGFGYETLSDEKLKGHIGFEHYEGEHAVAIMVKDLKSL